MGIYSILLIEDSPTDAAIIESGIRRSCLASSPGDEVRIQHKETLAAGLQILKQEHISIVLLDVHLPDGEGLQVVTSVYQARPDVPILILTGLEDDDLGMKAVQQGAQDYLVKGLVNSAALGRAIRYSIHRKGKEIEYLQEREAALKSERFQSTFLATMSHEIRTPLTSLLGFLHLARDPSISSEEQSHFLSIAESSGELLLNLVNDILELSSIKSGSLVLNPESFHLKSFCADIVRIFSLKSQQIGVPLFLEFDPQLPEYFKCDMRRLQQVLMNLVNNALKFTTKGKVILRLSLESMESQPAKKVRVRFSVIDTGIGIRPENLMKLFKPFEQTNKSIAINYGGTGLGLYISQSFIQKMGSSIEVQSIEKQGSEFYFILESTFENTDPHKESIYSHQKIDFKRSLKVLVVDDSPDLVLLIRYFLKGHMIQAADNGAKALEILNEESFDIVMMDMQMPVMNGHEATRRIREKERTLNRTPIPIVAMTGNVFKEDIQKSLDSGCTAHLCKPFKKQELFQVIQFCLETRTDDSIQKGS